MNLTNKDNENSMVNINYSFFHHDNCGNRILIKNNKLFICVLFYLIIDSIFIDD